MSEDKQSRIEAIFQAYRDSLPSSMAELESLWAELTTQWSVDLAVEFDRKVHNLAGSAATFELEQIGAVAKELEHHFKPLLNVEYDSANPRWSESGQLLDKLQQSIASNTN